MFLQIWLTFHRAKNGFKMEVISGICCSALTGVGTGKVCEREKRLQYWGPLVLSGARPLHHLWSNTVLRAIPDFLFGPLSQYDSYLPGRSLGVKGHLSPWAGQQHVDSLVGLFPKLSTWWVLPSSFPFRELRLFLGVVRLIHYLFLY